MIRWAPALCCALCVWGLVFASARAFADPYTPPPPPGGATEPSSEGSGSCPAGPTEPFEGEDVAAGETRLLRAELAEICAVLAAGADEVSHRLWWLVAEAIAAANQRSTGNGLQADIKERLEPPLETRIAGIEGGSLPVEDSAGGQYNDDLVAAVDASGEASKGALYFLVGVVVASFIGWALWRTMDRGT